MTNGMPDARRAIALSQRLFLLCGSFRRLPISAKKDAAAGMHRGFVCPARLDPKEAEKSPNHRFRFQPMRTRSL
jgi:hypothetical protein